MGYDKNDITEQVLKDVSEGDEIEIDTVSETDLDEDAEKNSKMYQVITPWVDNILVMECISDPFEGEQYCLEIIDNKFYWYPEGLKKNKLGINLNNILSIY